MSRRCTSSISLGHAFQLHRQPAGGFVHQVDRLVGQEAVGDVAVRQLGRGDERRVLDLHALVMRFVARLEPAQDGDRVFDVRLADEDRLEAPLQGRVLFDVLAIFVERRGADAAQLAAGEGRLEQVGRVAAAFGRAGADDRVQLVDEQDDVAARTSCTSRSTALSRSSNSPRNFVPAMRAPMSSAMTRLFLRLSRHVALDDAQGEPFDDGRLADARLADEHRIVLRAAREHLDHAADFLVAADHRVELALLGPLDQVDAVLFEGLEFAFGRLVGHAGAAAHGLQRVEQLVLRRWR